MIASRRRMLSIIVKRARDQTSKVSHLDRTIYNQAPLFEVGISLFTDGFGLVDPYDVRALHDLFRDEFPVVERQLPIIPGGGSEPFAVTGPDDDHHRWWFISEDERDLVQLQSNFMGRNWRRQALPGGEMPKYQGFIALLQSLKDSWQKVEEKVLAAGGTMPVLSRTEVFYDNLLRTGDGIRVRDLIQGIQLSSPAPLTQFAMTWNESLPGSASGSLKVEVRTVEAKTPTNEKGDFVRLRFIAKDDVSSIEEAVGLLTEAHDFITSRLHDLTTEACRATWKLT